MKHLSGIFSLYDNQKRKISSVNKFHIFTFFLFMACLCLCISLLTTQLFFPASSKNILVKSAPNTYPSGKPVIIIDPGHGGRDPGKVGTSKTLEKDINLKIAFYLKEMLETQNVEVIMTRDKDEDLAQTSSNFKSEDMKERVTIIQKNNAALVISIHQNSYTDPSVYGAQCFYYTDSAESKELAAILQKQIITSTKQTKIREIKSNNDYYLLKHSPIPTVIVECGFLSNPEEEQLLLTETYQRNMAWAIHLGILQYSNQK